MVFVENASRATSDLDFARSRPIRLACMLLTHRARAVASGGDKTPFIATIHAVCELEANDKVSWYKIAYACFECVVVLEPSRTPALSHSQRQELQSMCADRGIAAVTRALELGYNNVGRAEQLLATLKAMQGARGK
jgi:hypothetical protein